MAVRAVIFDMDGVIVDSERYWEDVMEEVIAEAVEDPDVTPADLTGVNVLDQHAMLAERDAVSVPREDYFDLYDRKAETIYTERASLMDGFPDLLDELDRRGLKLAISSSSFPDWIAMVLDRFGLGGRFDVVVSADELDVPGKPEPDIYEHVMRELGVDPSEVVVVEDSESGATAATRAGAYCVGYRTDVNADQDLSAADEVARGPEDLRRRLLEIVDGHA